MHSRYIESVSYFPPFRFWIAASGQDLLVGFIARLPVPTSHAADETSHDLPGTGLVGRF